ncbi:MAG: hypothetical protein LBJ93_01690 [Clostridiales bacterium]|jgi:DNA polymerase-1|nr:hypothetical protein [Clostridiales bacterium]
MCKIKDKKIILIDGNSIASRAFYGLPLLSNDNGEYTNAVYGFFNMIFKICDEELPTHLCVAFDLPSKNFRHDLDFKYKANRKPMPDYLRPQFFLIKNLLELMGIVFFEFEGFEADDILGSLAEKIKFEYKNDAEILIFSGDRDLLQLINENTKVLLPKTIAKKNILIRYDYKKVLDDFEIEPENLIDLKAIMGDKSDNISGVLGLGEKNAIKIIKEFKTLENAIKEISLKQDLTRYEKLLILYQNHALLCKKMVTIDRNLKINFDFNLAKVKYFFNNKVKRELHRLNIKSFDKRFN